MMKTKKLIRVTQKHIDDGTPESPWYCPVALALKDAGLINVDVNEQYIDYTSFDPSGYFKIETPQKLKKFLHEFDCGEEEVKPIQFYVPLVLNVKQLAMLEKAVNECLK